MDIEKLISLVFSKNNLWDMRNKNYHNRAMCRQQWQKISEEMSLSVGAVKLKWRGLRDTYRRELQKLSKKRSGYTGGMVLKSSWAYFSDLKFLNGQFIPRQVSSNLPQLELEEVREQAQYSSADFGSQECMTESSAEEETPTQKRSRNVDATPFNKRPRTESAKVFETLIQLEQRKLQQVEELWNARVADPDYHFMLSLVSSLKKVDEDRKFIVRRKLEQVFCDEEARKKQIHNTIQ